MFLFVVFRVRSVSQVWGTDFCFMCISHLFSSLCHRPGTWMCAIMQSSQLPSLQTDRWINEDNEITRAEGLGVLVGLDMVQL